MFETLTEKHGTFNHMIIFNDSISKFYQCSIWGFCQGIFMSFIICLSKKNAEVIKLFEILKKYVSGIKIYIFLFKKQKQFFA